jgi:transposase InsO family protein
VQYGCADYAERLEAQKIAISTSRPGNPYDNAKAESFMKTLKTEDVNRKAYANIEDAAGGSASSSKQSTIASACTRRSATNRRPSSNCGRSRQR